MKFDLTSKSGEKIQVEVYGPDYRENYRIHFFPKNGKIYIGYIGKHLPVSSEK